MNTFDFNRSSIRSWLTQGMVTFTSSDATSSSKKKPASSSKKKPAPSSVRTVLVSNFVALMLGVSIGASAETVSLPNQVATACSHVPDPSYLRKKALLESLQSIASLGDNWQREDTTAPSRQAVTAAMQIVDALPNTITDVSVGVDGDGNVYFKLRNGEKHAYLTVEPSTMHLLVMAPDQKNLYFDDVKFRPRELPSKIRQTLEQMMAG
jgi:hypothetical protein